MGGRQHAHGQDRSDRSHRRWRACDRDPNPSLTAVGARSRGKLLLASKVLARAFITTAHRGQNSPVDPAVQTPGVGRADVWVFDAENLDDSLGGNPLAVLTFFGDTPRALAATPDGRTVYAAVYLSGNQTTTVGVSEVAGTLGRDDPSKRLKKAPPFANVEGVPAPETGLIVKFNGHDWVDEAGTLLGQGAVSVA